MLTPCSCSRTSASRDHDSGLPPATSNARGGRSRSFPIRDGCRDRRHRRAGPHHGQSECRKRSRRRGTQRGRAGRAAVPRGRSLATRDRRAALHLAEHGQDPHPRAVPQAGRDIASGCGRARGGARSARARRITRVILGPRPPNRGHRQACWARMSAAPLSRRDRGRTRVTLRVRVRRDDSPAHDGETEITGPIIDSSHLHGLLDRIAGLGLTLHSLTPLDSDGARG